MKADAKKYIVKNKKASFDYFILSTYEAGLVLYGTEIKSIRQGNVNLKDSYCDFKEGELFVRGMHISPYEKGNIFNHDPLRLKKLLLHKRELMTLYGKTRQEGLTLIPLALYFSGPRVKMELGLCRGKKNYDKRETIAKKEAAREMEVRLKAKNQ